MWSVFECAIRKEATLQNLSLLLPCQKLVTSYNGSFYFITPKIQNFVVSLHTKCPWMVDQICWIQWMIKVGSEWYKESRRTTKVYITDIIQYQKPWVPVYVQVHSNLNAAILFWAIFANFHCICSFYFLALHAHISPIFIVVVVIHRYLLRPLHCWDDSQWQQEVQASQTQLFARLKPNCGSTSFHSVA